MEICAVVLAAGAGTRMKSRKSKVIQKIAGRTLIEWVRETLNRVGAQDQVYIVGYLQDQVRSALGEDVAFVIQEQQLGTGHAVMQAAPFLESRSGCTVILSGDAPLIKPESLQQAIEMFKTDGYAAVVITADADQPDGYGRIIRNGDGDIESIVEHRDATPEQREIVEINSGMYCFSTPKLLSALGRIGSSNAQNQYYLTDTIAILIEDGLRVGAYKAPFEETVGINDRMQLAQAAHIMNKRICERHQMAGVTLLDPDSTWIEDTVRIGMDTEILAGSRLEGNTVVGEDCVVGPNTRLRDVELENGVTIESSVAKGCHVCEDAQIGPFSHILPGTRIGRRSRVGAYVETENARIGDYTSAAHLAYIGDADIGTGVTFGAGCVTANDDGTGQKHTYIGDNAFIGSNSSLVAPLEIEANAYVAAGSAITESVPAHALALGRQRQTVKENWTRVNRKLRSTGIPSLPDETTIE